MLLIFHQLKYFTIFDEIQEVFFHSQVNICFEEGGGLYIFAKNQKQKKTEKENKVLKEFCLGPVI